MTTVEHTLAEKGRMDMVRRVRLVFQEAMAASFKGVVEQALGRRVVAYHSQILVQPRRRHRVLPARAEAHPPLFFFCFSPPRPRSSAAL